MSKFSLPSWLPPKEMPASRMKAILALVVLFIALPGLGLWLALHDGEWFFGVFLIALIYLPLLGYLGIRKWWRQRKSEGSTEDWNR